MSERAGDASMYVERERERETKETKNGTLQEE